MKTTLSLLISLMMISSPLYATEIFSDDFEDGVWEDSWTLIDSESFDAEITDQYAAAGQYSLHLGVAAIPTLVVW